MKLKYIVVIMKGLKLNSKATCVSMSPESPGMHTKVTLYAHTHKTEPNQELDRWITCPITN